MRPVIKNAKTSSACNKSVKGFTLIELLLSTMLGGILLSAVAFTFANMAGSFAEQPTTGQSFDWDVDNDAKNDPDPIPYSPAYSQLSSAFNLQAEISDALQATYKIGLLGQHYMLAKDDDGTNTHLPVTAIFVVSTDEGETLPTMPEGSNPDVSVVDAIETVTSSKLTSSAQFCTLLAPAGDPDYDGGYSIYFISGSKTVNMSVHCRYKNSGTDTIYYVKTYARGTFCPTLSYAFGVKNMDSSVLPSARCIKLRTNAAWGINEDVGTQVIFPDPSVIAYQIEATDDDAVRTYSRFAVLLPIKP